VLHILPATISPDTTIDTTKASKKNKSVGDKQLTALTAPALSQSDDGASTSSSSSSLYVPESNKSGRWRADASFSGRLEEEEGSTAYRNNQGRQQLMLGDVQAVLKVTQEPFVGLTSLLSVLM
jgi:hypothetical protein